VAGYEDCDVVIVGGGPAGLALASALGAYLLDIRESPSILILSQPQVIFLAAP
jgi:thioredoxin reductase